MKTVILALMVLVVFSQGEALKCYCGGTTKICSGRVETCSSNQVCGSIIIQVGPHVSHFKGCMNANDCRRLSSSQVTSGSCCSRDLCN
ncbi:hypothetical protein PBY51_001754 [Eleginops maclovinus]|uniref:Uncharacterized protein n=1 Tax=Eleginops maclovinus TaxID=56733 RepID=A0AAN8A6S7_ELEMC|nr:hypothetical protein PBY51_001754 [Eleginops maclovinus]